MVLSYSYIDPSDPVSIPERKVNGGLYTGEQFSTGAAWANIPVVPDAEVLIAENLKSANPPPNSEYFIPSYTRPGNNEQKLGKYQSMPLMNSRCWGTRSS